jgi:N-acetylglucosaminyldiphosphoundecaprenol N-acetyl-beta-D-mannosaminyltransferase
MRSEKTAYVKYGDVKISDVNYQSALSLVQQTIAKRERGYICLNDVSNIVTATRDDQMRAAINGSLLSLADGAPVAWYGRLAGCREIERVSGVTLMAGLLADLSGCRHYLLGDTEETIARVIAKAKELKPDIEISGFSPPFREFTEEDNRQILENIAQVDPDVVWVSFGGGKQEKWMMEQIAHIDHGVMVGAGAAFKFLIGDILTPPVIFQKLGLQWVFRLVQGFLRSPSTCVKTVRTRKVLSNKVIFLVKLPGEILAARQQLKLTEAKGR